MKNFITSVLISNENISFNSDILETNLINIIILVSTIGFVAKAPFQSMLQIRYQEIVKKIEGGETKLIEANLRLNDAKLQASQAFLVLEDLKNKTNQTNFKLLNNEFKKGNEELSQLFERTIPLILYRKQSVFNELIKIITGFVLDNVTITLKNETNLKQTILIDNMIKKLDNVIIKLGG